MGFFGQEGAGVFFLTSAPSRTAGGKHSLECTLILTEGDSAKSLAVSGLGVIGRDRYGVFPLRGKILNVREASHKQVSCPLISLAGRWVFAVCF